MIKRLEEMQTRFEELNQIIQDPELSLVELDGGHYFESLRLFHRIFKTKNILMLPWAFVVFFWKLFASTRSLTRYIRRRRPGLLLTAHYNAMTLAANFLAGKPHSL